MNKQNVQIIKNAALDDVRPGDRLVWERAREVGGVAIAVRREGTAAYQAGDGDWWAENGTWITDVAFGGTLTIRRQLAKED